MLFSLCNISLILYVFVWFPPTHSVIATDKACFSGDLFIHEKGRERAYMSGGKGGRQGREGIRKQTPH